MKKLSTSIALGLAFVLTLGMTAFAAESPTTSTANGVTVTSEDVKIWDAGETVANAGLAAATSIVAADAQAVKTFAIAPKDGQTVNGTTDFRAEFADGTFDTGAYDYYVLMLVGDKWEEVPGCYFESSTVINIPYNGQGTAFTIVKVAKDGDNGDDDDDDIDSAVTTTADGKAASPKTAETFPVAGVIAVIALAGIAVSAKKVCYNK